MIGFVAAEPLEFRGLEQHLLNVRRSFRPLQYMAAGALHGRPVVLAANGPGPTLVRQAVDQMETNELEALVSIGFCGALDPALRYGQIFFASEVRYENRIFPAGGTDGPLLSLDRVVTTAAEKRMLNRSGARAVEMEAGEVAQFAQARKIPFHCIRVVTDTAQENLPLDFNKLRDGAGRFSRPKIIARACLKPFKLFPELMQLDRRCRGAALALGDFIATCKF
jgi:adenosylhomocysteine nucleosidase